MDILFHNNRPPVLPSLLSYLASTAMLINIKIISTKDKPEPACQLLTILNCCSITLPINTILLPPRIFEIVNVVRDGTKTMIIPLTTPGKLRGHIIRIKVWKKFAPKSLAAFIISLSILIKLLYIGRIINGKKLYTIPIVIAVGVFMILIVGKCRNSSIWFRMPVFSSMFCQAKVRSNVFIHIGKIKISIIKLEFFKFKFLNIKASG